MKDKADYFYLSRNIRSAHFILQVCMYLPRSHICLSIQQYEERFGIYSRTRQDFSLLIARSTERLEMLFIVPNFREIMQCLWGLPPRNQWGPLTRWPSANTASQRGWTPLLSPLPPSSLYCNLYIKALYLRHKYNYSLKPTAVVITSYCVRPFHC